MQIFETRELWKNVLWIVTNWNVETIMHTKFDLWKANFNLICDNKIPPYLTTKTVFIL